MAQGTLYIVSAPSGAGKSSLIQALLKPNRCMTPVFLFHTPHANRVTVKSTVNIISLLIMMNLKK